MWNGNEFKTGIFGLPLRLLAREVYEKVLKKNDIYYELIGITQKKYFEIEGLIKLDINDLFKINSRWYNQFWCLYQLMKLKS